ncbi:MAG: hypothetical protein K2Q01_01840 [Rickettsiales bacterium]|nr:hypothetical protein [Rickettsiales bacterium]
MARLAWIAAAFLMMTAPAMAAERARLPAEDLQSAPVEKREEAVKTAKKLVDDFDARLHVLEADWKEKRTRMSKALVAKKEKEIARLKQAQETLKTRYGRLKRATKEAWEAARDAFLESYRDVQEQYDRVVSDTMAANG